MEGFCPPGRSLGYCLVRGTVPILARKVRKCVRGLGGCMQKHDSPPPPLLEREHLNLEGQGHTSKRAVCKINRARKYVERRLEMEGPLPPAR